jgi:amino acid permease
MKEKLFPAGADVPRPNPQKVKSPPQQQKQQTKKYRPCPYINLLGLGSILSPPGPTMSAYPEAAQGGPSDTPVLAARGSDSDGDELLNAMGYTAELKRNRSTWHVAFMSFVLASIPYGLATTLYYPLQGGGPVVVVWGWLLVSLIILCVAASLGEITSVYPTAGGVYYQTFMLAPSGFRRVAAYICGWAYVVGNITITLAVQFGTTLFFVACVNVFEKEPGVGVWQAETYQVFLTFLAITLLCTAISTFGNRWLPLLDVSSTLTPAFLLP